MVDREREQNVSFFLKKCGHDVALSRSREGHHHEQHATGQKGQDSVVSINENLTDSIELFENVNAIEQNRNGKPFPKQHGLDQNENDVIDFFAMKFAAQNVSIPEECRRHVYGK